MSGVHSLRRPRASLRRRGSRVAALALLAAGGAVASWLGAGSSEASPKAPASIEESSNGTPLPMPPGTTTHAMEVGSLSRSWLEVSSDKPGAADAPIIVVLGGIGESPGGELLRDGFVDLAEAGKAELIYPAGVDKSWNAGGCCGKASSLGVDDVAFIKQLVATVDPGRARPVYLVGYSNGGRLAYTLTNEDPSLFDAVAFMNADPRPDRDPSAPINAIQLDGTADPIVPYTTGEKGDESPPATVQSQRLRQVDGFSDSKGVTTTIGGLTLLSFTGGKDGTRYEFASFAGAGHAWFRGTATTPSEAEAIWAFFSHSSPVPGVLVPTTTK